MQLTKTTSSKENALQLGYKLCGSSSASSCYLDEDDLNFNSRGNSLTKLKSTDNTQDGLVTYGSILHDPESLENAREYDYYMFAVWNPNSEIAIVDFRAENGAIWSQSLDEDTWYRNNKRAGTVEYYEFDAS